MTGATAFAALLLLACPLQAQSSRATARPSKASKNVRIMRNEDGSFTEFKRSADDLVIERRTYGERKGGNGERVLRMSIIYRKDIHGKLRSGRIYDGTGKVLYRVVYGYRKSDGKLAAEDMFDARVKQTRVVRNPKTGKLEAKEIPVRRLYYRYDAQGRPSKPVVFCGPRGKKAEELFGKYGSSHYGTDPFSRK